MVGRLYPFLSFGQFSWFFFLTFAVSFKGQQSIFRGINFYSKKLQIRYSMWFLQPPTWTPRPIVINEVTWGPYKWPYKWVTTVFSLSFFCSYGPLLLAGDGSHLEEITKTFPPPRSKITNHPSFLFVGLVQWAFLGGSLSWRMELNLARVVP